jgi:hypothetical protein
VHPPVAPGRAPACCTWHTARSAGPAGGPPAGRPLLAAACARLPRAAVAQRRSFCPAPPLPAPSSSAACTAQLLIAAPPPSPPS